MELQKERVRAGICGLLKRETLQDVDIGFAFLSFGKVYAISQHRCAAYGRDVVGLNRIIAITDQIIMTINQCSQKLGMEFQGMIKLSEDSGN